MATTVVVTTKGNEVESGRMIGTSPSQAEPKVLGWGTGSGTAAITDVGPFVEAAESRVTGTSSQATSAGGTTNNTYQVVGTITSLSGQTITEMLLADSATKPFSTTWATAPSGTGGTSGTLAASYTPANNTYIQCESEVMQVTAGTGTTSVTVTRAQNGSTAATHANGTTVTLGNPPGTSTANATMAVHASFTGLALSTGDGIQFTTGIKFS